LEINDAKDLKASKVTSSKKSF